MWVCEPLLLDSSISIIKCFQRMLPSLLLMFQELLIIDIISDHIYADI